MVLNRSFSFFLCAILFSSLAAETPRERGERLLKMLRQKDTASKVASEAAARELLSAPDEIDLSVQDAQDQATLFIEAVDFSSDILASLLQRAGSRAKEFLAMRAKPKNDLNLTIDALSYALLYMRYEQAKLLLEAGIDVNLRDERGGDCLTLMLFLGSKQLFDLLVLHGATVTNAAPVFLATIVEHLNAQADAGKQNFVELREAYYLWLSHQPGGEYAQSAPTHREYFEVGTEEPFPAAIYVRPDETYVFTEEFKRMRGREVIKALCERNTKRLDELWQLPFDALVTDAEGTTALMLAIVHDPVRVESLLNRGSDVDAADNSGMTPLSLVLMQENPVKIIKLLLQHHADPNKPFGQSGKLVMPLACAAVQGLPDSVVCLRAAGAKLITPVAEKKGVRALTAEHLAACAAARPEKSAVYAEISRLLFGVSLPVSAAAASRAGASNLALGEVERQLWNSIKRDDVAAVGSLFEQHPISPACGVRLMDEHGDTPLHHAAYYGAFATAQFLFERVGCCEINCKNVYGFTPCDAVLAGKRSGDACGKEHDRVLSYLLSKGGLYNKFAQSMSH